MSTFYEYTVDLALTNKQLSLALLAIAGAISYVRYIRSPWRKLPPGPPGIPLLGNLLQIQDKPWLSFTKWKDTYGPIMHLNLAGQPVVVLSSQKVAADLLDRKASIYSDRPNNIVASDLMTGGLLVVFTHYNDVWRRMRRAGHEALNKGVVRKYQPIQLNEAVLLAHNMLANPTSWDGHFRRAAASAIISMVYDKEPIKTTQEPTVRDVNDFVARLTRAAMPGAHFVEFFTWMKYIPAQLAGWKRQALASYQADYRMFKDLFDSVRERMTQGDERPSLAATLIQDSERNQLSVTENVWLAGTMYAAGAETTSGVLAWWMLAMVAYPETQKRAQKEIERVVGRDRLPSFNDIENMPYVRAMAKEALRWRPVDPVGLPHRSVEDDWYEGHFIPKHSIVIANVWHLNRDPEIYGPDAHHFNPARHLDANGQLGNAPPDTKEESHVTYGFGRRICVGRHVANNSLFIDIAIMLWAMNIERGTDKYGMPTPLDVDGCIEDGLVVRPIPFEVKITPRFPEAFAMLEHSKEDLNLKRVKET
ncbi:unnamed protein product [Cyclocybe aegerita]|uniref:Cytochrome P450 n=1 Tax=Cyclocybe aegerita TaxID=1973307 RepID=A0A8S0XY31_CYCAE|nr:unnamed protein product [Cyclocybe aegerita]